MVSFRLHGVADANAKAELAGRMGTKRRCEYVAMVRRLQPEIVDDSPRSRALRFAALHYIMIGRMNVHYSWRRGMNEN